MRLSIISISRWQVLIGTCFTCLSVTIILIKQIPFKADNINPRTYTQSHLDPDRGTRGEGGLMESPPPPLSFLHVAIFWNDFAFSGKLLIFSTRWGIFYVWWHCLRSVTSPNVVAIFDLSRNNNQVKTVRINNFSRFTWKITHKYLLCIISSTSFILIVEKSWKNMHFHSKMAWPHATYVIISRNHRNWWSLNLSQNAHKG